MWCTVIIWIDELYLNYWECVTVLLGCILLIYYDTPRYNALNTTYWEGVEGVVKLAVSIIVYLSNVLPSLFLLLESQLRCVEWEFVNLRRSSPIVWG